MSARRILLVEDEPSLVITLTDRLSAEGYQGRHVADGREALEDSATRSVDLVVLDVSLPGKDGFEVCRVQRSRGLGLAILMLTARAELADRVVGLRLGADDYLTKPFEMLELLARIEALLRRSGAPAPELVTCGHLRIDLRSAQVTRKGQPVELSALEWKLLRYFVEHRNALLSRDELLDRVWGYQAGLQTRTVDVHVSSLRHKLEETPGKPRHLVTVHGLGYRFVDQPTES